MQLTGLETSNHKHYVLYNRTTGTYYSDDKTFTTTNKDEMAKTLGCSPDDIVQTTPLRYNHIVRAGALIEPDTEVPNRVRMSLWRLTNAATSKDHKVATFTVCSNDYRPSWVYTGNYKDLGEEYTPYIYVYNDGRISHEDAYTKEERIKNRKPHTVRSTCAISSARLMPYLGNTTLYDLNIEESFGETTRMDETTLATLKAANFPESYIPNGCTTSVKIDSITALINYITTHKTFIAPSKELTHYTETLEPFGPEDRVKIEKIGQGTLFRLRSRYLPNGDQENGRLLITPSGVISQSSLITNPETGELEWSRMNRGPEWFYHTLHDNREQIKEEGIKDLVAENPKYKYVNEYINNNINVLLRTMDRDTYGYYGEGLIEFLRLVNKNPVIIDGLLKLGYQNIMMRTNNSYDGSWYEGETPVKSTIDVPGAVVEIEDRPDTYWDGANYRTRIRHTSRTYWKEFSTGLFTSGVFGKLKKATGFFAALDITKEQWRYITTTFGDKLKENAGLFWIIGDAKLWFCGLTAKGDVPLNARYKSLKEVPLPLFMDFVYVWQLCNKDHTGPTTYSYFFSTISNRTWYTRLITDVAYCEQQPYINRYKAIKHCEKYGINYGQYVDYLAMRENCEGKPGYNPADWPVIVPASQLTLFHDRLVELSNRASIEHRKQEETERQAMYTKLVPKLRKFNFETDDDDRCVVCPEDLIDIVIEGQRLSHCVGSYTGSVAQGKEVILFLRKKATKDSSYATIDVQYNSDLNIWKVRQIHTAHNGPITEDDVAFLKKWAKSNNVDESTINTNYGALCALH